jgi:hypothetical protein
MLTATVILARLRAQGFAVTLTPDLRLCVTPGRRVTPELAEELRSHREALLEALARECPWPVGFRCPACGTREVHGHG